MTTFSRITTFLKTLVNVNLKTNILHGHHNGAVASTVASQLEGCGSTCRSFCVGFQSSPHVGSLQVLWPAPTIQRHASLGDLTTLNCP